MEPSAKVTFTMPSVTSTTDVLLARACAAKRDQHRFCRGARQRAKAENGRCEDRKPPGEAAVIERIKALRLTGMAADKIAGQLNAEGIKPRAGVRWHATFVHSASEPPSVPTWVYALAGSYTVRHRLCDLSQQCKRSRGLLLVVESELPVFRRRWERQWFW